MYRETALDAPEMAQVRRALDFMLRQQEPYHPRGLRPYIVNWEATAAAFIQWLQRDLLRTGDAETRRLLDELLSYPDVPRQWQTLDLDASTAPFLAIELRKGDVRFSFYGRGPPPPRRRGTLLRPSSIGASTAGSRRLKLVPT